MDAVFSEFMRVCKIPNFLIFCSNKQVSKTMSWFEDKDLAVTLLVWHKENAIPLCYQKHVSDIEFIVYARGHGATFNNDVPQKYKSKLYTSAVVSNQNRLHPTQKGVDHIRQYLQTFTNEGDVVLDPFIGSGTTAVACVKEKRHFIGFEIDSGFFGKANKRILNEQQQLTLF